MTYENGIPDYALVPAKEPWEKVVVPAGKNAIYSPVQVTDITERPKTVIVIEEDILVPDTKPDMREILMIDGKGRLSAREIDKVSKNDDYINLSGEIELQTLYLPERMESAGPIIAIQTRVPFKEKWHTDLSPGSSLVLEVKVEKVDCMVVNERKYRVKISLAVYAKEYRDSKIDIFEGIKGEEIQMLKEKAEITNVAMRKKDSLSIREEIEIKDDVKIDAILKQDISIIENYKQVSGEKVVINGFILLNILYYCGGTDETPMIENIRQMQEKVEFTQFIPIQQIEQSSGSNVSFDDSDLKIKLVQDEEGNDILRLEGEILTYVEIYKNTEKEIIVDGYHREKDFICDFREEPGRTLIGTSVGEASVREIISPENIIGEIDGIIYTTGGIISGESRGEQGKVITEGKLQAKMICKTKEMLMSSEEEPGLRVFCVKEEVPYRVVASIPQISGGERISHKINIKDIWAEKINGKQVEFNATLTVTSEIMKETSFKVVANPAFEEGNNKKTIPPMAIYVVKEGDSIWTIAKKFKTTVESVKEANNLEDDYILEGMKLLINA